MGVVEWIIRRIGRKKSTVERERPSALEIAKPQPSRVPLEQQLATLAELGLSLEDGATAEDLLESFSRDEYETNPYDLILFMLGCEVEREPWGRPFCSRARNFDTECIYETGDYAKIVNRLAKLAGDPDWLTDVRDEVDIENKKALLEYSAKGRVRRLHPDVNGDWCDGNAVMVVMSDLERDGNRFFVKENGQAMVVFYLSQVVAEEINKLANGSGPQLLLAR